MEMYGNVWDSNVVAVLAAFVGIFVVVVVDERGRKLSMCRLEGNREEKEE